MKRDVIYKYHFIIVRLGDDYLIHNTHKPFEEGHSHQHSLNACIALAVLVKKKEIPRNRQKRFLKSLIRLAEDPDYIRKIKELNTDFSGLMKSGNGIDTGRCDGR